MYIFVQAAFGVTWSRHNDSAVLPRPPGCFLVFLFANIEDMYPLRSPTAPHAPDGRATASHWAWLATDRSDLLVHPSRLKNQKSHENLQKIQIFSFFNLFSCHPPASSDRGKCFRPRRTLEDGGVAMGNIFKKI